MDNQLFVACCSPARDESASYTAWGHSMVIGPYAQILAEAEAEPTTLFADCDLNEIAQRRWVARRPCSPECVGVSLFFTSGVPRCVALAYPRNGMHTRACHHCRDAMWCCGTELVRWRVRLSTKSGDLLNLQLGMDRSTAL